MAAALSGPQWVLPIGTYLVTFAPRNAGVVTEGNRATTSQPIAPSQWDPRSAASRSNLAYTADWGAFGIYYGPDGTIGHSGSPSSGNSSIGRPVLSPVEVALPPFQVTAGGAGGSHVATPSKFAEGATPGGSALPFQIATFGAQPAGSAAGGAVAPPGEVQLQLTSLLDQSASPGAESGRATAGRVRPDGGQTLFRIARTPVGDTRLEVNYSLAAYSKAGPATREGAVVLAAGSPSVDLPGAALPSGNASPPEIVTLTLLGRGKAQAAGSSLTLFLPGEARRCSEAALLAAHREEGSAQAFAALVERYRGAVLRSCYRVLGSWHDAEDVSQVVFLALAQGKMRLHSTLSGWLTAVARNASLVFLRSRRRRRRHEQHAAQPLSATYEEFTAGLREEVEAVLARLSGPLREAVELRYLEGWSQAEASQLLGCPRGTLSRRASMGLQRLRDILGAEGEGGLED